MAIFNYLEYKAFLRHQIQRNADVKGYKSLLAQAAGCQRAYISQVLGSEVQLTPDHALGLCEFWSLSELEQDYFLTMVDHTRAATSRLRKFLENRLRELKSKHENLAERFRQPEITDPAQQQIYYSKWHLSAIHILVTIPAFQTAQAISSRLGLPLPLVQGGLIQLESMGLIESVKNRWQGTQTSIHLPSKSPLITLHHRNWRDQALVNSQIPGGDSIHYTSVISISVSDYEKIKERLLQVIDEIRETVKPSREEELVGFVVDYFKV